MSYLAALNDRRFGAGPGDKVMGGGPGGICREGTVIAEAERERVWAIGLDAWSERRGGDHLMRLSTKVPHASPPQRKTAQLPATRRSWLE